MRKIIGGMMTWVLVVSVAAAAGSNLGNEEEHRIVLTVASAQEAGVAVRHHLGNGRVSVEVSGRQLDMLRRMNISYGLVPERSIQVPETEPMRRPKQPVRAIPQTQVPYGIKMIYGNAILSKMDISGGAGINVAVLDTGSVKHPDFVRADGTSVIVDCVDFSQRGKPVVQGACKDGHGHGTHVIGTIAAAGGQDGLGIFGVAPQVNIFSYKVLTDSGRGSVDDVARAIRYAVDHGAHIISMSLGSSTASPDEAEAVRYAVSQGVLVIAAAGNSGPGADTIGYPGGYAEVVGVAALGSNEVVTAFSSRGLTDRDDSSIADREVEVAGPGRTTLSTSNSMDYIVYSGTSMATPHIAGLAAKMWQGSAAATRDWLRQSAQAHDITAAEQMDNAGPGYDIAAGYGLPQVNLMRQTAWSD